MNAKRLWRAFPTAALLVKIGVLLVNFRTFPDLKPRPPSAKRSRVSILIPARDEAHNLAVTLPLLLAQGADEVIVLDDQSSDNTAALARRLGAKVLAGKPLPHGWRGKNWACQQLYEEAGGDILIFTDADVSWQAGALDSVLHELEHSRADLLSVFPQGRYGTLGERLITPLLDDVLLCFFPAPLLKLPFASASAAIGQCMVFRRGAYEKLGGHAAVRGEIMEDVVFGQKVKAGGGQLALALGQSLMTVRMYASYPDSVRGFGKNALPFHRGSRPALVLTWGLHLLIYTLPWLRREPLPIALSLLEGLLVRRKVGRTRPADTAEVLLTPALPLLGLPVYLLALRRQVAWKGRKYES